MKVSIVYWSGTGNTEAMANAVAEGAKKFGSYDWGDGEWMRTWQQRVEAAGGVMIEDGLICNNAPDDEALAACRALGEKAAK